jgi:FMN phosphatase YigB (HAD superfamily)
METRNVTPKAVVFDVYGTLLEVGPAPVDGEAQWERLWKDMLGTRARLTRLEFAVACNREIAHRHEAARARGISHPEINWLSIVAGVLPEIANLSAADRSEFAFRQIQTGHSTRLHPGVDILLPRLKARGMLLGLASNAQAYTLRELDKVLAPAGLNLGIFDADLSFWSFKHGFSKPDPHVFRILTTRLEALGLTPHDALMVGDRLDNDVEPARAQGWQTWLITTVESSRPHSGTWNQLERWLA